jgi:hypothetical protein
MLTSGEKIALEAGTGLSKVALSNRSAFTLGPGHHALCTLKRHYEARFKALHPTMEWIFNTCA